MIHLSDRQVEDYRRRALSPRELLAVDDHMATCPECRLRLAEGESLSGSLAVWDELGKGEVPPVSRPVPGPPPGLRHGWAFATATALLAVMGLAISLTVWRSRPGAGLVAGLESLPAAQRQAVAAALRTGRLDPPPEIADLAGQGSVLRGSSAPPPEFVLLAPLATALPGGRPVFRWTLSFKVTGSALSGEGLRREPEAGGRQRSHLGSRVAAERAPAAGSLQLAGGGPARRRGADGP